jgi:transcriptional regulator GlxA family with amidase domain
MFSAAFLGSSLKTRPELELFYVAQNTGPVEATGGVKLYAEHDFDSEVQFDWVFLPPLWGSPWKQIQSQLRLHRWLQERYAGGSRIVCTGTGVGMVAMSGLLDDRVATTHWYYLPKFRKRFDQIRFQTEHFMTHQDGIYCAGSINAQTDLVLFFIEKYFGEDSLSLVEQQFMHELKRNFSTPYYEPGGLIHDDEVVSLVQSWMRAHLADSVTMQQLVGVAGHSERQLRRRFFNATHESPMNYLMRIRVEEAQSLLRETNLSVTEIAISVGFNSSAYFSRAFKKATALSAGDYRKVVRKKSFSSN